MLDCLDEGEGGITLIHFEACLPLQLRAGLDSCIHSVAKLRLTFSHRAASITGEFKRIQLRKSSKPKREVAELWQTPRDDTAL